MKNEEKVVKRTLIKTLSVLYMAIDKGLMLTSSNSQEIIDYAAKELKEVGREDLVDKAKEHYRRNKDKIRVKF